MTAIVDKVSVRNRVQALIATKKESDPKLYEALNKISDQLDQHHKTLQPPTANPPQALPSLPATIAVPANVTVFGYTVGSTYLRFNFTKVDPNIDQIEIRLGTVWNNGSFVYRGRQSPVDLTKPAPGNYTYMIKTINGNGIYSAAHTALAVTV